MSKMKRLILLTMLALTMFGVPASAVTQSESDNTDAVMLLPAASTLGDDWSLLATDFPGERHPAFRAAATATYGGPQGARIVIDVMLVAEGVAAASEAWDRAYAYLEWYEANMLPEENLQRDQEVAAMQGPPGCQDALRLEGRERIGSTAFPIGVTVCAEDPDVILVAAVSGSWDGLSGVAASDAVIEVISTSSVATPGP